MDTVIQADTCTRPLSTSPLSLACTSLHHFLLHLHAVRAAEQIALRNDLHQVVIENAVHIGSSKTPNLQGACTGGHSLVGMLCQPPTHTTAIATTAQCG